MRGRLSLFIVILTLSEVTHSQLTIQDDDFEDSWSALDNELSKLTAQVEAVEQTMSFVAGSNIQPVLLLYCWSAKAPICSGCVVAVRRP